MKTGKSLKVVALYAGPRREWKETHGSEEELKIIKYWYHVLKATDYGTNMDVLFVNNSANGKYKNDQPYLKYLSVLNNLHGKKIRNGTIMVAYRPNIGAMIGAFNYAFQEYKNDYDYFWFSEDDRINVSEGAMSDGINIIKNSQDSKNPIGFVCTAAFIRRMRGCRGSAGITSSKILKELFTGDMGQPNFLMLTSKNIEVQANSLNHIQYEFRLNRHIHNNGYKLGTSSPGYDIGIIWRRYPARNGKYRKGWSVKSLPPDVDGNSAWWDPVCEYKGKWSKALGFIQKAIAIWPPMEPSTHKDK